MRIPGLETYYGGKNGAGVYQTIINQLPPHDIYIEPFLGSGAIMRHKRLAKYNYGFDKDSQVTLAWKQANLKHIKVLCTDAIEELLNFMQTNVKQLIYADPPYPVLSRETKRNTYRCEMTNPQHEELLGRLLLMPCMVCVSSYDNPMYNEYLKGWRTLEYSAKTRKGVATEKLYMNYPEPTALHDYRYYGETKNKRQDYKKKVSGYLNKFKNMEPIERNGVISALLDLGND